MTRVKTIGASEFAAGRFGIPVRFLKKKQSKVAGQKKQLRLDLTGVHICTRARDRNNTATNDKGFDFSA